MKECKRFVEKKQESEMKMKRDQEEKRKGEKRKI